MSMNRSNSHEEQDIPGTFLSLSGHASSSTLSSPFRSHPLGGSSSSEIIFSPLRETVKAERGDIETCLSLEQPRSIPFFQQEHHTAFARDDVSCMDQHNERRHQLDFSMVDRHGSLTPESQRPDLMCQEKMHTFNMDEHEHDQDHHHHHHVHDGAFIARGNHQGERFVSEHRETSMFEQGHQFREPSPFERRESPLFNPREAALFDQRPTASYEQSREPSPFDKREPSLFERRPSPLFEQRESSYDHYRTETNVGFAEHHHKVSESLNHHKDHEVQHHHTALSFQISPKPTYVESSVDEHHKHESPQEQKTASWLGVFDHSQHHSVLVNNGKDKRPISASVFHMQQPFVPGNHALGLFLQRNENQVVSGNQELGLFMHHADHQNDHATFQQQQQNDHAALQQQQRSDHASFHQQQQSDHATFHKQSQQNDIVTLNKDQQDIRFPEQQRDASNLEKPNGIRFFEQQGLLASHQTQGFAADLKFASTNRLPFSLSQTHWQGQFRTSFNDLKREQRKLSAQEPCRETPVQSNVVSPKHPPFDAPQTNLQGPFESQQIDIKVEEERPSAFETCQEISDDPNIVSPNRPPLASQKTHLEGQFHGSMNDMNFPSHGQQEEQSKDLNISTEGNLSNRTVTLNDQGLDLEHGKATSLNNSCEGYNQTCMEQSSLDENVADTESGKHVHMDVIFDSQKETTLGENLENQISEKKSDLETKTVEGSSPKSNISAVPADQPKTNSCPANLNEISTEKKLDISEVSSEYKFLSTGKHSMEAPSPQTKVDALQGASEQLHISLDHFPKSEVGSMEQHSSDLEQNEAGYSSKPEVCFMEQHSSDQEKNEAGQSSNPELSFVDQQPADQGKHVILHSSNPELSFVEQQPSHHGKHEIGHSSNPEVSFVEQQPPDHGKHEIGHSSNPEVIFVEQQPQDQGKHEIAYSLNPEVSFAEQQTSDEGKHDIQLSSNPELSFVEQQASGQGKREIGHSSKPEVIMPQQSSDQGKCEIGNSSRPEISFMEQQTSDKVNHQIGPQTSFSQPSLSPSHDEQNNTPKDHHFSLSTQSSSASLQGPEQAYQAPHAHLHSTQNSEHVQSSCTSLNYIHQSQQGYSGSCPGPIISSDFEKVYPLPLANHDAVSRDRNLFMETLRSLLSALGLEFTIPRFGESNVDLHTLYKQVTGRGGLELVNRCRKWNEVALSLNFHPNITVAAEFLSNTYGSILHHYEQVYYFGARGKINPLPNDNGVYASSMEHDDVKVFSQNIEEQDGPQIVNDHSPQQMKVDPAASVGTTVTGAIDGKFDSGYLVTVMVGGRIMRGVLYHVAAPNSVPQNTCTQGIMQPVHVDIKSPSLTPQVGRKRKKNEVFRKDPNAPRQNRTGYNFFFAEQRAKLKTMQPDKDRAISKMIGELWNKLSEDEKIPYQAQGLKDKERYIREMKEYKERNKLCMVSADASNSPKAVPPRHPIYSSEATNGSKAILPQTPSRYSNVTSNGPIGVPSHPGNTRTNTVPSHAPSDSNVIVSRATYPNNLYMQNSQGVLNVSSSQSSVINETTSSVAFSSISAVPTSVHMMNGSTHTAGVQNSAALTDRGEHPTPMQE